MENLLLIFEAPALGVQLVVEGILLGAIFALAAYGMALVWGVMNIINIVQGEWVILGGFVALGVSQAGAPELLGIPAAAVVLFAIGWLCYRLVIFRIVDRDLFTSILATFGLSILLQQLMNELFGSDVRTLDPGLGTWFMMGGMVSISQVKVLGFVLAGVIAVALTLFMRNSRMGQAIRATAQDARAARILGIDTDRVYAFTYGLNAAICGAAGALVVMAFTIHPYQGLIYTVRSFTIVVVAGLGNLPGVIASAFGLGVAEQFAGFTLGAEYQNAFVFLLLVAILISRNMLLQRQRKYLK
ncbi:branched-chain amino acid ABC transporter permease [Ferruginivarius sediminum]|uniref:Branched-chain amino acid ABC transporter permease n=1 Tax=Ferruginivarius sediminum TaxID=2661937 RepID=A0A369TET0_9PROT|nr:branched-chain amino acid ABC transporter permease [Ferruginivarius sediminum]RDD63871.1 branched-chain amino acid ABC transporter permease [Ferruginivarius sediminum]